MSLIHSESAHTFALLTPKHCPPRPADYIGTELEQWLKYVPPAGSLAAIDFETRGNDITDPDFAAVGIGIASEAGLAYLDLRGLSKDEVSKVYTRIRTLKLIGHNVMFDGGVLQVEDPGKPWPRWEYCTFGLYKQLAGEGFFGQQWGLKPAQVDLLLWEDKGDIRLVEWLAENGHFKGTSKSVDKGKMYLAPTDILGEYCCDDAWSTWLLYHEIFEPLLRRFPQVRRYHREEFMTLDRLLIAQQIRGAGVNRDKLLGWHSHLTSEIERAAESFLARPEVQPTLARRRDKFLDEHDKKEPAELTKKGAVSKNWLKWKAKREAIESRSPAELLNLNSGQQLAELFYGDLGFEIEVKTDSGAGSTGEDALLGFGELGQLLIARGKSDKELEYVEACVQKSERTGRVHFQSKNPHTLTCRITGAGGLNALQIPSSQGYMECYIPDPGNVFINTDFTSLEQIVLAEDSQDPQLMKLYGPDAKRSFNLDEVTELLDNKRITYKVEDGRLVVDE